MATTNFVVTPSGAGYAESDGLNPVSSTEATCIIIGDKLSIVLKKGGSWKPTKLEDCTLNGNPLSNDPRVAIEELAAAGFRTPSGGSGGGDTITNNQLTYVGDQLTSVITTDQSIFTSNSVNIIENVFSSGLTTWSSQVLNTINVPNNSSGVNLLDFIPQSTTGSNNSLPITIVEDAVNGNYIQLDYLGTDENLLIDLGFAGSQGGTDFLRIELRRVNPNGTTGETVERSRTTFPINDADSPFGKVIIPTLATGANDVYYTQGFRIFLINTTGGAFSIPPTINFQDINEDNFFRLYISRNFTKTITV